MGLTDRERRGGVVLMGGQSTRMGQDKTQLRLGEYTLLERVIAALSPAVGPIVLVASPDARMPEWSGVSSLLSLLGVSGQAAPFCDERITVVRDEEMGMGPLYGIARGLAALPESVSAAFVAPCDAGLLTTPWIDYFFSQSREADIVIAKVGPWLEPLGGIYARRVASTADTLLANGKRAVRALYAHHPTRYLDEAALRSLSPDLLPLRNANTPEDFEAMQSAWRQAEAESRPQ